MKEILAIDQYLFFFINHVGHTVFLDFLARALSGIGYGGIVFLLLGIVLVLREEKRDHWFFLPLAFTASISWLVSEVFLKIGLGRLRPETLAGAIVVGTSPGTYSFPSTHATIAFACAVLLSVKEPKWRWWLFTLAFLIGLSRIYLGYHYPVDVIGGSIIGLCIGILGIEIARHNRR
jgi:undecaprenyl-diphosphatase